MGNRAALLVLGLIALALSLSGCGGGKASRSTAALGLEREDLAAVAHALSREQTPVGAEIAATKAAWPLIVNGLPKDLSTLPRPAILLAAQRAAQLSTPALFDEHTAATLTGPGSQLAGEFRNFVILATRGWQMTSVAIEQIERGPRVSAHFARANVNLYIETVYDAHYTLAQIGKQLLAGYRKLGGSDVFGVALTQQEVDALALAYSEASARLHPHTGVKLGS